MLLGLQGESKKPKKGDRNEDENERQGRQGSIHGSQRLEAQRKGQKMKTKTNVKAGQGPFMDPSG